MSLANQVVESFNNAAGVTLSRGMIVQGTTGARQTLLAQANTSANLASIIGVANNQTGPGGRYFATIAGEVEVLLETGLTPTATQIVYVSASVAGRGTTAAPVLAVSIGMITDASSYSLSGRVMVSLFAPNATSSMNWDPNSVRYMAVSYANGSDSNLGYSDVSMAAAGAVALKTLTALTTKLPVIGAGRKVVIAIESRAAGANYLKPDGLTNDDLLLLGIYGYEKMLVRGTITDATAGSVAFANTAADKLMAGFIRAPGTNTAGYNVTVNTSNRQKTVQLAGGGAVALATNYTFRSFRIRFDSATTTAGLRNVTRQLSLVSGAGNVFHLDEDLPAVPVTGNSGDVFYIEAAGVSVASLKTSIQNVHNFTVNLTGDTSRVGATTIVGIKQTLTGSPASFGAFSMKGVGDVLEMCGVWGNAAIQVVTGQYMVAMTPFYNDETETLIRVGCGFKSDAALATSIGDLFDGTQVANLDMTSSSFSASVGCQVVGCHYPNIGMGCSFNCLLVNSCGWDTTESAIANSIGIASSATKKPPLVDGTDGNLKAFSIEDSQVTLRLIECINAGSLPAIRASGTSVRLDIAGPFGSTGNNAHGFEIVDSFGGSFFFTSATTVTGALGDINLAGTVTATYAGLLLTNVVDDNSNEVEGAGGHVVSACKRVVNKSGVALTVGALVRSNGTTNQVTSAFGNDAAAGNSNVVGVMITSPANDANGHMACADAPVCNFDGVPTIGAIAYLSPTTTRTLTTTIPALAANNNKLRVGRVIQAIGAGNDARVAWHPENLAVVADGAA